MSYKLKASFVMKKKSNLLSTIKIKQKQKITIDWLNPKLQRDFSKGFLTAKTSSRKVLHLSRQTNCADQNFTTCPFAYPNNKTLSLFVKRISTKTNFISDLGQKSWSNIAWVIHWWSESIKMLPTNLNTRLNKCFARIRN